MVIFAYEHSMQRDVRNKRKVFLGDVDLIYMCDEEEGADDNTVMNTIRVRMTKEEDENSVVKVWTDYLIDVLVEED